MNRIAIEKLPRLFDLAVAPHWHALGPTEESIGRINDHFKIVLPNSLIQFARQSKHYGGWFSSIGPDYESPAHIMHANALFHGADIRMPPWLVMINRGFDQDCDCLDTRRWNHQNGEYAIQPWSPGVEDDGHHANSFHEYAENHIRFWLEGLKGPNRTLAENLLGAL